MSSSITLVGEEEVTTDTKEGKYLIFIYSNPIEEAGAEVDTKNIKRDLIPETNPAPTPEIAERIRSIRKRGIDLDPDPGLDQDQDPDQDLRRDLSPDHALPRNVLLFLFIK